MMKNLRILLTIASVNIFAIALDAGEWANWRGPNGLGISDETNLPVQWGTQKNVAWKSALPGQGTSSAAVFGDRVFITTQTDDESLHVLALHAQHGEILWNTKVGQGKLPAHNLHNMATPTPVTDGHHVWAHFGTGDLVCLNSDGKIIWQRNLVQEYGAYRSNHGMGNSPMIVDGKLLIACMHQGPSYLLAVDPLTGKNIWKTERNLDSKEEAMDSYSSPVVAHLDNQTQVILSGADHLDAYDPATGSQIWISSGLQVPHPYGRSISGPTFGENTVITVASGFRNQGFVLAVNPNGTGDISASGKLWESKRFAPDCPSPLIYQGLVFTIRDDGMASCLDLKSGEPYWQERLFSQNVKVSPVAADGHIYFSSGEGECKVVRASKSFEILHSNDLDEYMIASPAIAHGAIYFRTQSTLYCIRTP